MNDREVMIFLIVCILALAAGYIYTLVANRKKSEEVEKVQPPETTSEIIEQPVVSEPMPVQIQENPKISALRRSTEQSLLLNMQMLDSVCQMARTAGKHNINNTVNHHQQNDPWHRRNEWWQSDDGRH